jgi:hypothetical protein
MKIPFRFSGPPESTVSPVGSRRRNVSQAFFVSCIAFGSALLVSGAFSLALFAADKPPPKRDPLLADLAVQADLKWSGTNSNNEPPNLDIDVEMRGAAAALATDVLETRIDELLDQDGKSYRRRCKCGVTGWGDSGVSLSITVPNRPAITTVREFRGNALLLTGGEHRVIVVNNAFKTPGKPIQDKALAAAGLVVTVDLAHQAKQESEFNYRNNITLSIRLGGKSEPKDRASRIIRFSLVDEEGVVPISSSMGSGNNNTHEYRFGTNAPISPETGLQLVIHAGARSLRVPFAFKNLTVPQVPLELDVPAAPAKDAVEAETVPANDPILAGLTIRAEATPRAVILHLEGKPIERASRLGDIEFDPVFDETGETVYFQANNWMQRMTCQMSGRIADPDFEANQPNIRFDIVEDQHPKKLRELRGSLVLQTGGQLETVVLNDLLKNADVPIQNAAMKSLGVSLDRIQRYNEWPAKAKNEVESLLLDLSWKGTNLVSSAELLDGKETPLPREKSTALFWDNSVIWRSYHKTQLPSDAQLKIVVHKNSRRIRVPFVFKDIVLSPPKNDNKTAAAPAKTR